MSTVICQQLYVSSYMSAVICQQLYVSSYMSTLIIYVIYISTVILCAFLRACVLFSKTMSRSKDIQRHEDT